MNSVLIIPAFCDNFIYLYRYDKGRALAVDVCDSSYVLRAAARHELRITHVLVTHQHWDHVAGVSELKRQTGCKVIGGEECKMPCIDCVVGDGHILSIGSAKVQVVGTPGHTAGSLCYYVRAREQGGAGIVWTGDTLFVGGCGRLLGSPAKIMWDSLVKLKSLPDDTLVYCGHDYTIENYEFALTIEPANSAVKQALEHAINVRRQGGHIVPSNIKQEKKTNIFLRANTAEVRTALKMPSAEAAEVFAELRRRKDIF